MLGLQKGSMSTGKIDRHNPVLVQHTLGSKAYTTRLRLDEAQRATGVSRYYTKGSNQHKHTRNGRHQHRVPHIRSEDRHLLFPQHSIEVMKKKMARFPMRQELQGVAQKNNKTIEHDVMLHIMSNYSHQMIAAAYAGFGSIDMYIPRSSGLFPSYNHTEVVRLIMNELRSRQFSVTYNDNKSAGGDPEIVIAEWTAS